MRSPFYCVGFLLIIMSCMITRVALADHQTPSELKSTVKPVVNLCYIAQPNEPTTMHHAVNAHKYYASKFSDNATFRFEVLAKEQNKDTRNLIASIVSTPFKCHGYIGPPYSSFCKRAAFYIQSPWVSDTASSTDLSDKFVYPSFSRAIPSDAAGGLAVSQVVKALGYTKINVLGIDEPYSRSVIRAFTSSFSKDQYGTIAKTSILSMKPTQDEAAASVASILESDVFVTLIASTQYPEFYLPLMEAAVKQDLNKKHVILTAETWCTLVVNGVPATALTNWTGSFCITYDTVAAAVEPYTASWVVDGRNTTAHITTPVDNNVTVLVGGEQGTASERVHPYAGLGYAPMSDAFYKSKPTSFDSLSVDAVHLMMTAFSTAIGEHVAGMSSPPTTSAELEAIEKLIIANSTFMLPRLRSTVIDGLTGKITLSEAGDRNGGIILVHNVGPDGFLNPIAHTEAGSEEDFTLPFNDGKGFYWKGSKYSHDVPQQEAPPAEDTTQIKMIIGVFVGVFVLLVVLLLLYRFKKNNPKLVKELVASGLWGAIGFIFLLILDLGTDVYSCYLVSTTDNGTEDFQHAFIGLVSIGGLCSITEMITFIRAFRATLQLHQDSVLTLDHRKLATEASHLNYLDALVSSISLIIQHIPLFVMSIVAIENKTHFMYVASTILSAIVIGYKLQTAGLVWEKITRAEYDPMSLASVTKGKVIDSTTDREIVTATRIAHALKYPRRHHNVEEQFQRVARELSAEGISQNDFFAVILPALTCAYEESNGASLRHASTLTASQLHKRLSASDPLEGGELADATVNDKSTVIPVGMEIHGGDAGKKKSVLDDNPSTAATNPLATKPSSSKRLKKNHQHDRDVELDSCSTSSWSVESRPTSTGSSRRSSRRSSVSSIVSSEKKKDGHPSPQSMSLDDGGREQAGVVPVRTEINEVKENSDQDSTSLIVVPPQASIRPPVPDQGETPL